MLTAPIFKSFGLYIYDLLLSQDRRNATILGFLELSATLDTINHHILQGEV